MNLVLEKWSYFFEEIQTCSVVSAVSAVSLSKKNKNSRSGTEKNTYSNKSFMKKDVIKNTK